MSKGESDLESKKLECGCVEYTTIYRNGDKLVRTDFCSYHAKKHIDGGDRITRGNNYQ